MNHEEMLKGTPKERVEIALKSIQKGNGIIVTDNENRENEGDMIFSAENLTNEQMALLIREGSGIVCLCLKPEKADELNLPLMVENNTSTYGTAFTITIEAAEGVTTGVSAAIELKQFKLLVKIMQNLKTYIIPDMYFL